MAVPSPGAVLDEVDRSLSPQEDNDVTGDTEVLPVPQPPPRAPTVSSKVSVLVKKKRVKSPVPYTVPVLPAVEKPNWKRKVVRVVKKRPSPEESRGNKDTLGAGGVSASDGDTPVAEGNVVAVRGPLVDIQGNVVEHSYVGSREDFDAYAERYIAHLTPASDHVSNRTTTKVVSTDGKKDVKEQDDALEEATLSDSHKHLLIYQRMLELRDEHALCNWTQHNEVWKKQQAYLARRLNTTIDELVMSRNEEYREIVEERLVIERAIPILEKGLGDFWRTNLQIGSALTGLSMPVTKSGRGIPPQILHVGKPKAVHEEQNYQSRNNLNYPWKDSVYLADRRRQLRELLDAIDPHAPHISELQVVANGLTNIEGLKSMLKGTDEENRKSLRDDDEDAEGGLEKQRKKSQAWRSRSDNLPLGCSQSSRSSCEALEAEDPLLPQHGPALKVGAERVVLEAQTGTCTRQCMSLKNTGSIALRYYFVQELGSAPAPINHSGFYFDPNERIILPGEHVNIPFHFKSERSGIFTERWHIVTSPPVANTKPITSSTLRGIGPITLRGIATEDDLMKPKRAAIHRMLEQRAPITFIGRLVRDMVDMAPVISHMQQRANAAKVVTAPVDNSSETQFMRKNASFAIHFHRDVVNALSDLASEIYDSTHDVTITREEEGTKRQSKSATSPVLVTELEDSNGEEDLENAKPAFVWDLSLDTLNEMILAADTVGDEQCEGYMQRFNALVEQLYTEVREPVRDEKYNATSRLLCQLAEKTALAMESKMSKAVEAEEGGGDTRAVGDESEEAPESATSEVPATEEQATVSLSVAKEAPTIVHAHVLDMVRNFADMIMYI